MKVLHVCYADNFGGAFIGAHRLHSCMVAAGVDSELLVIKKRTDDPRVIQVPIKINILNLIWRKLSRLILLTQQTPDTEFRTLNLFPTCISKIINAHRADIVQFHWINNNTIGLSEFRKINKPIVWKLPDMWAFCGAEHYTKNETRYTEGYTKENKPSDHHGLDIDRYSWEQKKKYWKNVNLTIVCPSKWLADCARKSYLFKNYDVFNIPNPINMDIFKPADDIVAVRSHFNLPLNKRLILFSSMAKLKYSRKGFNYLVDCMQLFSETADKSQYAVVCMGSKSPVDTMGGFEVINLGTITDINEIAEAYSAMDVTMVPSSADNLPNVIKESMACGVPCVSFNAGGIPDMITHKVNGYLAPVGDYHELAAGLEWIFEQYKSKISASARESAMQMHGHKQIVDKYLQLYEDITGNGQKSL